LKRFYLPTVLAAALLTACTDSNVKPQMAEENAPPATQEQTAQGSTKAPASTPAANTVGGTVTQTDFERLESRFSLAQEQLLGLITQSAQTKQLNQQILLQLQGIENIVGSQNPGEGSDPNGYDTSALDALLEQLLMVANGLGGDSGGAGVYDVAMTYTDDGDWKLIRYHRTTGETWLAEGNNWQPLDDGEVLPESSYLVSLIRAERDAKGFSAVRMDRNSGRLWWLKQNSWQAYSE